MTKTVWTLFAGLAVLAVAFAKEELTLENCKCSDGYKPQKNDDGTLECAGIHVYNIEPCNTIRPPDCKCTGDVNGILIDETGTWCSSFVKDKEQKKWACENEEEWVAFKKNNA